MIKDRTTYKLNIENNTENLLLNSFAISALAFITVQCLTGKLTLKFRIKFEFLEYLNFRCNFMGQW